MTTILTPGIHLNVSEQEYHQDPCPSPSLSASIANVLINKSPRHAWTAHPKLNPDWQPDDPDAKLDFGTVAHTLLLGRGRPLTILDFDDWRKKEAQTLRKEAREAGMLAVLRKHYDQAEAMVASAREQLKLIDDCYDAFTEGDAEVVLTWQEKTMDGADPIWCRSMIDWISPKRATGHYVSYDFKTTGADISPDTLGRHLYDMSYEVPAAMYERGLEAILGDAAGCVVVRFVVQEKEPPYLLHVAEMGPDGMTIGRKKVAYAIAMWRRCLHENNWPGYAAKIIRADMPTWHENRWLEREMREADDLGEDPFMIASKWIPPRTEKALVMLAEGG